MFPAQIQDIFLRRHATCVLGEALSHGQNLLDSGHVPEQERRPSERLGLHPAATAGSHGRQPVVGRVGDAGEGLPPMQRRAAVPSSLLSSLGAPTSRTMASSSGRMPTTPDRRSISSSTRSSGFVEAIWGQCSRGTSSREASIRPRASAASRGARRRPRPPGPGPMTVHRTGDLPPLLPEEPPSPPDLDASVSRSAGVAPTPARRADDGGRACPPRDRDLGRSGSRPSPAPPPPSPQLCPTFRTGW